ncbi:MAG: hypothetical protein WCO00_03500 [Rhodospirillaceae bacterium]
MSLCTRRLGALALGAALFAAAVPALADEGARPGAGVEAGRGQVAVVAIVRARDLITPAERRAYRQAMREAQTPEARQRLREATIERLHQRAAEHGVVMMIDARMMRPSQRWSEHEPHPVRPLPAR